MSKRLQELEAKRKLLQKESKSILNDLGSLRQETIRVANVAHNTETILKDLNLQFEQYTKLNSVDTSFLFFATALQCIRQYILSNKSFRFQTDQQASKVFKKYTPISLYGPVPYDAFKKNDFIGNTGISGANHRYTTLGHDPLLGWVFGTLNILTDTVTKNNLYLESYNTTLIGNEYKISGVSNMMFILNDGISRIQSNPTDLGLALMKHTAHLSSDAFTKMGLPVPIINNISPTLTQTLMKNGIDAYSITRGVTVSCLINTIISFVHTLFYDERRDGSLDVYQAKTKKIIMYSNSIATSSNIIYTALTRDLSNLDAGGILVTIYRLINDTKFIQDVKQEFIREQYLNKIKGI